MTETILKCSIELMENRRKLKKAFPKENCRVHMACAGVYAYKGKLVDVRYLEKCRDVLEKSDSTIWRSTKLPKAVIASIIAVNEASETLLSWTEELYEKLEKAFPDAENLVIAAFCIAEKIVPERYGQLVQRAEAISRRMEREYPFLGREEESALCAIMAMQQRSDEELLQDAAACYPLLAEIFRHSEAVWALSCVLAMYGGKPEEKCERVRHLYAKLIVAGFRYGTHYELPTLGILAMTKRNSDELVADLVIVCSWLAKEIGGGFWGQISDRQCLLYAGLIVEQDDYRRGRDRISREQESRMLLAGQMVICGAVAADAAVAG